MVSRGGLARSLSIVAVMAASQLAIGQTEWTGNTGDFLSAGNWSSGVPARGVEAIINNGGTAQLTTSGLVQTDKITLGSVAATSGSLEVSNADLQPYTLSIGNVGTGEVTVDSGYVDSNGTGVSADIFVGGHDDGSTGEGTLTINGGYVRSDDDIQLGRNGTGTLNYNGGVLRGGYTVVGKFGTGTWNQSGGVYVQDFGDVEIGDGGKPNQTGIEGPSTGHH